MQRVGKQDCREFKEKSIHTGKEVKENKPDQTGRSILGKKVADTGDLRDEKQKAKSK